MNIIDLQTGVELERTRARVYENLVSALLDACDKAFDELENEGNADLGEVRELSDLVRGVKS